MFNATCSRVAGPRAAFHARWRDARKGPLHYVGGPKHGQRGRGAANKVLGAGAVEVRGEGSGRVQLTVIPTASKEGLTRFVQANVVEGSTIVTDGLSGYEATGAMGYDHQPQIQGDPRNPRNILPRIHRGFSNLKTCLAGTHHGVGPKNLPVYLQEFVFRFNRRKTPMAAFHALLGLTAPHPPEPVRRRQRESDSIR